MTTATEITRGFGRLTVVMPKLPCNCEGVKHVGHIKDHCILPDGERLHVTGVIRWNGNLAYCEAETVETLARNLEDRYPSLKPALMKRPVLGQWLRDAGVN